MLKICGGRLFFGALVALTSASWSYAESPESIVHRQMEAIQPFASELIGTYGAESIEASVVRASSLVGIHADSVASNPTVELRFSSLPVYEMSLAPNSLTVSFSNAIVLNDIEKMYVDGGTLVTAITATQSSVSPNFVTNVTLTTNQAFSVTTKDIGNALHLTVVPSDASLDAALVSAQQASSARFVRAAVQEYRLRKSGAVAEHARHYSQVSDQIAAELELAKLLLLEHELAQVAPASTQSAAGLTETIATFERDTTALMDSYDRSQMLYHQAAEKAVVGIGAQDSSEAIARCVDQMDSSLDAMKSNVTTLRTKVDAAHRLVSRTNQAIASTRTGSASTGSLANLDSAVTELRIESVDSERDSIDALEIAMDSVNTATADLAVAAPVNAAIRLTPSESIEDAVNPPAKRTRPAAHSLTTSSIASPRKMQTLGASTDEIVSAADQGMLVLAQATENATPETLTSDSTPSADTPQERRRIVVNNQRANAKPKYNLYNEELAPEDDPLRKLVNIDFKDMELANVVSLLAQKGQIDVIASVDLSGKVTANLSNIPLGRAIEVVLRMNDLGIVEETGIYRITTYEEAVASRQDTEMIFLQNAEARAVKDTLDEITTQAGGGAGERVRIGVNTQSNILVLSGPRERVDELVSVIEQIDIAEPIIPTVNKTFRLNYADPGEIANIIKPILSENGQITAEVRSGQVILTDIPVKIAEITLLIAELDIAVEQVSIEAMVVDNFISDGGDIGANMLLTSDSSNPLDGTSKFLSSGSGPNLSSDSTDVDDNTGAISTLLGQGGTIGFGFVNNKRLLQAQIQAQVQSNDAVLLANPVVVTLENQDAEINITTDFPFEEKTQSTDGGTTVSTSFKEVGTILKVNPKITFDEQIIVAIEAEESTITGLNVAGIPISALRKANTTMRMGNGQTVYIAGLRRLSDSETQTKVPILGDIPVLGLLFKTTSTDTQNTELMIFLTCTIVQDVFQELTPYQKQKYDTLGGVEKSDIDATRKMVDAYGKDQMRDPIYKWRRAK